MNVIDHHSVGTASNNSSAIAVANSLAGRTAKVSAKADSTGSSSDTSSDTSNATITANDFLTLLVSELQNQDPTQPTDPDSYIQQLVGVNSLQQLISINQGIAALDGSVAPTQSSTSS